MGAMQHAEQHRFESRFGRIAAAASIAAALLLIAGNILLNATLRGAGEGTRGVLPAFEREAGRVIGAGVLQAVGTLLLAGVLLYLYRATRYRVPSVPTVTKVLALAGPVLVAVTELGLQLALIDAGREFVSSGARTEGRAEDLIRDGSAAPVQYAAYAARSVLGIAFVLVSLNALRAGLLTRFMGYIGIIIGALFILSVLFGGPSFVLIFWLPALALLLLDRWPGGRGPAWAAGEAVPWPSAAEQRQALARKRAEDDDVPAAGGANGAGPASADPDTPQGATPRKRKRRRR